MRLHFFGERYFASRGNDAVQIFLFRLIGCLLLNALHKSLCAACTLLRYSHSHLRELYNVQMSVCSLSLSLA